MRVIVTVCLLGTAAACSSGPDGSAPERVTEAVTGHGSGATGPHIGPSAPAGGFDWNPHWSKLDTGSTRLTSPPAVVHLHNGLHFFARGDGDVLVHAMPVASGYSIVTYPVGVTSAPTTVGQGNAIDVFFVGGSDPEATIKTGQVLRHVRVSATTGALDPFPDGSYQDDRIGGAGGDGTAPAVTLSTVTRTITVGRFEIPTDAPRIDVFYTVPDYTPVTCPPPVQIDGQTVQRPCTGGDFDGMHLWHAKLIGDDFPLRSEVFAFPTRFGRTATSTGPGKIDLIYVDTDLHVQHMSYDESRSTPWRNEPTIAGVVALGTPALAAVTAGHYELTVPEFAGIFRTSGRFGVFDEPWTKINECTHAAPLNEPVIPGAAQETLVSRPGLTAYGRGLFDLAIWGDDGQIWYTDYGVAALHTDPPLTPPCTVACGAKDQFCCASSCTGSNLICDVPTDTCVDCGHAGERCCSAATCDTGLGCGPAGTCDPCGAVGEICCAGGTCGSATVCNGSTCVPCGGDREACCVGDACDPNEQCASDCTSGACGTGSVCDSVLSFDYAYSLFATHCSGCHGSVTHVPGADIGWFYGPGPGESLASAEATTLARLTATAREVAEPYVTPGDTSHSYLYDKLLSGAMPPFGGPLADQDIEAVRRWIVAGANE